MKHWNPDNIGYWVIGAGCKIKKDQEPQSLKLFKRFLKIIALWILVGSG